MSILGKTTFLLSLLGSGSIAMAHPPCSSLYTSQANLIRVLKSLKADDLLPPKTRELAKQIFPDARYEITTEPTVLEAEGLFSYLTEGYILRLSLLTSSLKESKRVVRVFMALPEPKTLVIDNLNLISPKQADPFDWDLNGQVDFKGLPFSDFIQLKKSLVQMARQMGATRIWTSAVSSYAVAKLYRYIGFKPSGLLAENFYAHLDLIYQALRKSKYKEQINPESFYDLINLRTAQRETTLAAQELLQKGKADHDYVFIKDENGKPLAVVFPRLQVKDKIIKDKIYALKSGLTKDGNYLRNKYSETFIAWRDLKQQTLNLEYQLEGPNTAP